MRLYPVPDLLDTPYPVPGPGRATRQATAQANHLYLARYLEPICLNPIRYPHFLRDHTPVPCACSSFV